MDATTATTWDKKSNYSDGRFNLIQKLAGRFCKMIGQNRPLFKFWITSKTIVNIASNIFISIT